MKTSHLPAKRIGINLNRIYEGHRRLFALCLILGGVFASHMAAWAHERSLIDAVKLPGDMTFCGEAVPSEVGQVRERFEKEMLLSLWDRPQVLLWLKRSPRYFPFIEQQLKELGLPDDLKYLAVAESALRPHAGSFKGAVGFWQLMPETARRYGLTVDRFIDERRNLNLSTPAALGYLKALHQKFESWTLALAAYNMGEEGLTAEVLEQDTKNYYHLYIPLETQRFIFRLLSIKLILTDPEAYGFAIQSEDRYKPIDFDTVGVDCFKEVPIQLIAEAAGTYFKNIKDLNPHLRGHYVQAGHLKINVPAGKAKGFNDRFKKLVAKFSRTLRQRIYIVQNGDSLSEIADKFEVPLAAILIWNRLDLKRPIHPGDRLIIYPRRLSDVRP
ncbi:MAG: transglycosylase SLT domain-containing protein [Desulfobacteraceae bacterium]